MGFPKSVFSVNTLLGLSQSTIWGRNCYLNGLPDHSFKSAKQGNRFLMDAITKMSSQGVLIKAITLL